MAAAVRHIFGPFTSTQQIKDAEKNPRLHDLRFHFFGVRSDGSVPRWVLIYDATKRSFHAQGVSAGTGCRNDRMNAMLPRPISEMPVLRGKVVDLLRARLSREDMARCLALSVRVS